MRTLVLDKDLAVIDGRDGRFLVNRNDRFIGRSLELYGEYNSGEAEGLKRLLKPGNTVIEVGANIGSHTVGLAKAVGPAGKVFAFEPQRACFALLQSQIALNQLTNVFAFQAGIGADNKTLYLSPMDYTATGNFGGVALEAKAGKDKEAVAMTKLDDRFVGIPVHLIKIDAEGMEQDVIEGGRETIARSKPTLYVENDRVERSPALIGLIQELGYRLWWHTPPLYSPTNFFGNPENIFATMASFNMICMHRTRGNIGRLKEIKAPDEPHPLAPLRARQAAEAAAKNAKKP